MKQKNGNVNKLHIMQNKRKATNNNANKQRQDASPTNKQPKNIYDIS